MGMSNEELLNCRGRDSPWKELFPDAVVFENVVKDGVGGDVFAKNGRDGGDGIAKVLSHQIGGGAGAKSKRNSGDVFTCLFQGFKMADIGD